MKWFKRSGGVSEDRSLIVGEEPKCFTCGVTHTKLKAEVRAMGPNMVLIGLGLGVCPQCRKAFCRRHMIPADPHDFFDMQKCPDCRADLDSDWDKAPTSEKPWRLGPFENALR